MGQYYTPVLKDKNGNFTAFYSHTYGSGLKLMEHSYVGNNFVNAVCNELYKNPHYVCWEGDYVEIDELMETGWFATEQEASAHYRNVWSDDNGKVCFVKPCAENQKYDWSDENYLINHTKKIFLEVPKEGDYVVHPLPILTAKSNGRGGGDYWGINRDAAGKWWGDLIEISNEVPQDYKQVIIDFKE